MFKTIMLIIVMYFPLQANSEINPDSIPNNIDLGDGSTMKYSEQFGFEYSLLVLGYMKKHIATLSSILMALDSSQTMSEVEEYRKTNDLIYLDAVNHPTFIKGTLLSQELKLRRLELKIAELEGAEKSLIKEKKESYNRLRDSVLVFWKSYHLAD